MGFGGGFGGNISLPSSGGGSSTSDPVEANAATLVLGDWTDVNTDTGGSAGSALTALTKEGAGITLKVPSGQLYAAARWAGAIPAGDFLISGDLAIDRPEANAATTPGIAAALGVCPGGLTEANPSWFACNIDGMTAKMSAIAPQGIFRESSALWAEVNEGIIGSGFGSGYSYRFAMQRSGSDLLSWVIDRNDNNRMIQIGSRTSVGVGLTDVFVRTRTAGADGGVPRYAILNRLALTGLAIVDGFLVSA